MEADAYADSSFLVSLHRADEHHERARAFIGRTQAILYFTPLQRLELRNALRNAVGWKQMTPAASRAAFRQIEEDLRDQLLVHTPVDWANAFRRAEDLSEKYAVEQRQRAIDLLHVAIAIECRAKTFLSFDKRQRKLAQAAGLRVKP